MVPTVRPRETKVNYSDSIHAPIAKVTRIVY